MKLISFLLRASPQRVAIAIVTGLLAGVCNAGLLVVINNALNRTATSSDMLIGAFVALCLALLVSRSISSILLIYLSRWSVYDLRLKLSRQIIDVPLRQLEELGAARLVATLTEDVPAISVGLVNIPVFCMHLAVVLTSLVYMCWLSPAVFVGVLCFMVLGIISYYIPFMRAQHYMVASRQKWDLVMKHIQALTEGTKELKLNQRRRAAFFAEELEPTADALRREGYIGDRVFSFATIWGQLLVFILIGLLLFHLPNLRNVDARTLTGYTLVILYMMTPLETIMNLMPIMGRANVAIKKVETLGLSLKEKAVEALTNSGQLTTGDYQTLELVGVTHTYYRDDMESSFQLGPLDLSFQPGELVFLIGSNGSGKTTFAKLLTGLYHPEAGEVRLNGQAITDDNREQYRQLFAGVFTDFYLFEKLLGIETAKLDEKLQDYLIQFHLAHKVQIDGGAFSTTALSHGQRKRLALITSYLEDRPFYVFDEWAADQDPLFKEIFYLQLLPQLKARGKTVLVISHDDRYYHVADYLIKLDYGRISQSRYVDQPQPTLVP